MYQSTLSSEVFPRLNELDRRLQEIELLRSSKHHNDQPLLVLSLRKKLEEKMLHLLDKYTQTQERLSNIQTKMELLLEKYDRKLSSFESLNFEDSPKGSSRQFTRSRGYHLSNILDEDEDNQLRTHSMSSHQRKDQLVDLEEEEEDHHEKELVVNADIDREAEIERAELEHNDEEKQDQEAMPEKMKEIEEEEQREREEEQRRKEEQSRKEEEQRKREEEQREREEEQIRKEAEQRKREEEERRKYEEQRKREEEERRRIEEQKREELRRAEEEQKRRLEDQKKRDEICRQKMEEAIKKEAEQQARLRGLEEIRKKKEQEEQEAKRAAQQQQLQQQDALYESFRSTHNVRPPYKIVDENDKEKEQLKLLNETLRGMGFTDDARNMELLIKHKKDIQQVVDEILGGFQ